MLIVALRARGLEFSDIDDVCQEVWMRAWRHLQTGRELDRPAGWLRQVAMNLVYSNKRRRQQIPASQFISHTKDEQLFANLVDESLGDGTLHDTPKATIENERRVAIRSCLDSLPKSDSEILGKVYSGMKPRQIAADLGLDPNTLYTRKHRAFGRFKQCLEGKKVP
jgi:RNA polymerase sigma-70 factor (ECF subfamily)